MSDAWYYEEDGKTLGPVSLEQLKSDLLKRPDWRDHFIWRAGTSDWIKAGDVPELATIPPPLPSRQKTSPTPVVAKEPEPQQFLYKAAGVVITPTLARFGNVTYPINGIGSVRVDPPNRQKLPVGSLLAAADEISGLSDDSGAAPDQSPAGDTAVDELTERPSWALPQGSPKAFDAYNGPSQPTPVTRQSAANDCR